MGCPSSSEERGFRAGTSKSSTTSSKSPYTEYGQRISLWVSFVPIIWFTKIHQTQTRGPKSNRSSSTQLLLLSEVSPPRSLRFTSTCSHIYLLFSILIVTSGTSSPSPPTHLLLRHSYPLPRSLTTHPLYQYLAASLLPIKRTGVPKQTPYCPFAPSSLFRIPRTMHLTNTLWLPISSHTIGFSPSAFLSLLYSSIQVYHRTRHLDPSFTRHHTRQAHPMKSQPCTSAPATRPPNTPLLNHGKHGFI